MMTQYMTNKDLEELVKKAEDKKGQERHSFLMRSLPWGVSIPSSGLGLFAELLKMENEEDTTMGEKPKDFIVVQQSQSAYGKPSAISKAVSITFASLIESRDKCTGGHVKRSAEMAISIAQELAKNPHYSSAITSDYLNSLAYAAPLHDVGKIVIPDAILNKPGKLTPAEFEIIKTHTTEGKRFIDQLNADLQNTTRLSLASEIAYTHHEWWNGKGYPQGLSGENIPLSGRIVAVADVYDALISKRPYKEALPKAIAIQMITKESGTHFDPAIVEAFLHVIG